MLKFPLCHLLDFNHLYTHSLADKTLQRLPFLAIVPEPLVYEAILRQSVSDGWRMGTASDVQLLKSPVITHLLTTDLPLLCLGAASHSSPLFSSVTHYFNHQCEEMIVLVLLREEGD